MILAVVAMVMGVMAPASAGEPTCAGEDLGNGPIVNHGEHATEDYATPGVPGAVHGGPGHFGVAATPGATFCNQHGDNEAPDLGADHKPLP